MAPVSASSPKRHRVRAGRRAVFARRRGRAGTGPVTAPASASTRPTRVGMSGSPSRLAAHPRQLAPLSNAALWNQRSGSPQVGMDQPFGIGAVGGGGDEVLGRGAERNESVAVVDGTDADRTRSGIAGASRDRDAGRQAERRATPGSKALAATLPSAMRGICVRSAPSPPGSRATRRAAPRRATASRRRRKGR